MSFAGTAVVVLPFRRDPLLAVRFSLLDVSHSLVVSVVGSTEALQVDGVTRDDRISEALHLFGHDLDGIGWRAAFSYQAPSGFHCVLQMSMSFFGA